MQLDTSRHYLMAAGAKQNDMIGAQFSKLFDTTKLTSSLDIINNIHTTRDS
jgi:hypothetical protein